MSHNMHIYERITERKLSGETHETIVILRLTVWFRVDIRSKATDGKHRKKQKWRHGACCMYR